MDTNTDRIINLLIATASEGELAGGIRNDIIEGADALAENEEFKAAANDCTTDFVDAVLDAAIELVEEIGDVRRALGMVIGTAHLTGLMTGLSIATLAAEA